MILHEKLKVLLLEAGWYKEVLFLGLDYLSF